MEPRFGRHLAHVRVHTDARAAESARAVHAQAYTVGPNVVFGESKFTPSTPAGRELLAHELAHTLQQRSPAGSPPKDHASSPHEQAANTAARSVAAGRTVPLALPASGIGLSRTPTDDDDRAQAVAEAEALLKRMEEDERKTARDEAEDEVRLRKQAESKIPTTLSLIRHDPKWEAAQFTDDQIYLTPDQLRAQAVAEAEASLVEMAQEELETKHQEEDERIEEQEAEQQRVESRMPRLSLLGLGFESSLISDDEIYESVREPKPEEAAYWAKQADDWLDKPIEISSETKYVRTWREETVEGVGDQGDKHIWVENSHWKMTGGALRGYIQYMAGPLTPFEQLLVEGQNEKLKSFTPVVAGDSLGYFSVTGESGNRQHTIYNRDGTIFQQWFTEQSLINMGIGPLALALPGIGLRSMLRGGASLGRSALGVGNRVLQPLKGPARKAVLTAKLAIGRAEAGAGYAAPTALGGYASRNSVTLTTARPVATSNGGVSQTLEAGAEVANIPAATATARAATQSATTGVATTEAAAATSTPSAATVIPGLQAIGDLTGIPEEIPAEDSSQITNRITAAESDFGEVVGEYRVFGDKGLEGSEGKTFVRNIWGLKRPAGRTTDTRPIQQFFALLVAEARAAGATELRIVGRAIRNKNVKRFRIFIERMGGRVRDIDTLTNEIIIPL